MAYFDTAWYVSFGNGSTTGYYAVPVRPQNAAVTAGTFARQFTAPAIGSERVFVCTVAGTTANTTDATWSTITRGGKNVDGTVTWQECTGAAGSNGDSVNTPNWTAVTKGLVTNISIGAIIQDNNGVSLQICSVAGNTAAGSGPTFNTTLGAATTDSQVTWVCIGAVATMLDWSAPHARLTNAMASGWGIGSSDYYVADNSAETSTAAINFGAIGSGAVAAGGSRIFSADHTATLPVTPAGLKAGASFTSSAATAGAIGIGSAQGSNYWYGCTFIASAAYTSAALMSIGNSSASRHRLENCSFQLTGGASGSTLQLCNQSAEVELINCTFSFSSAGQFFVPSGGKLIWRSTPNPSILGTIPTSLFRATNSVTNTMLIEGVDLTALGSSTLVTNANSGLLLTIKNCTLHTGSIVPAPVATFTESYVDVVTSDSGSAVTRNERHTAFGDLTTSATVYRSGGATSGTNPLSHYIVTSQYARASWRAFDCLALPIWNDLVGSTRTVTLYGYVPGASAPLPYNDQFWFDAEYMSSTLTPIASFSSNGLATQLTPHAVVATADSSTWTGAPAGTAFALTASFTAQQHGYLYIYPKVGTSFTMYLDPKPVLS